MSQENGRDYFYYSANQHSIQMELMADLVCNFIRQRAETDAGQGHAFSVFIKFFRLQLGVAGIPDEEKITVFHKAQFLGNWAGPFILTSWTTGATPSRKRIYMCRISAQTARPAAAS